MGGAIAPFFSVVIPTFERPKELTACLTSLAALDYDRQAFEVLVVDDGGTRSLNRLIASFRETFAVTLLRQENSGPAAARNHGARHANGDWLVFIDDDCAPAHDYLSRLSARIADAPDCIMGGQTVNALTDNIYSTASQMLSDYLYSYYNADPQNARFLTSNNMAVPTHLFRAAGGFDIGFTQAAFEDRELCHRLIARGGRIIHAPEAIVYHAHRMTLRRYWRQHFTYGRGASTFHRKHRDRPTGAATPEPVRFYVDLVRYPLEQRGRPDAVALSALMIVSQAATALGFLRERLSSAWRPRRTA